MARSIEQFKAFFAGFEDNYVIIGGTACEIHEEIYTQTPRATKDIDIKMFEKSCLGEEHYRVRQLNCVIGSQPVRL
ncbi:MAG: hypothetical protein LKF48_09655 [Prevotella sp.]|jgi:predicted nucleotidyltransferase|nr:hypothetical protein [Prevotella sp.]MCH4183405.1 hypothetical protein [Prevotella sp.]